jgi:hypothetical protein
MEEFACLEFRKACEPRVIWSEALEDRVKFQNSSPSHPRSGHLAQRMGLSGTAAGRARPLRGSDGRHLGIAGSNAGRG